MSQLQRNFVRVLLNEQLCRNCLDAEVAASDGPGASTFRVTLAASASPDDPVWAGLAMGEAETSGIQLEIQMGVADDRDGTLAWASEIVGVVDHVALDVENGVVELEGRDFMSRLFNAPSSQNFVNQTSSEIVATLGNEAGLAVQADPTTTIVGQYYQLEHARTALNAFTRFTTALDVITYLAQLEGYDCWVKGSTLYFMRPGLTQRSVVIDVSRLTSGVGSPIPISRLRFDRRTAFDTGACVTVKSWNSRQRIAVEASYPQSSAGASFVFVAPNLLDDSASQRAQTLQRDIARHGMTVTGETTQWPGFDVRDQLQILNSNGWDGSYIVDKVTKQVSGRRGFTQTFAAHVQ